VVLLKSIYEVDESSISSTHPIDKAVFEESELEERKKQLEEYHFRRQK